MSEGPKFITLEEASAMTSGTRVTFVPGIPAMFSEALKNICYVKGIPLIRVLHPRMGIDDATGENLQAKLYEITSQTSLPTMLHDQERPRNVWIEQLALAEQIGKPGTPRLIPANLEQRVDVIGLSSLVLAEDGLAWNMRILVDSPLARKYGFSEEASAAAPEKIAEIIAVLDGRLEAQEQTGSRYLVGDSLTALDLYWATLSMTVMPAPEEIMPLTRQNQGMMKFFEANSRVPEVAQAISQRLRDHQRYILSTYCETPAVLGGDLL